ncbi:MAG: tetratricopeptide repeat protein [Myxococcota bacterium]
MELESLERRLAAILSADAVGYSRLMSDDEEGTVRTLQSHRRCIERLIDTFRGRLVDAPGDNLLAEFPSAVGSVRCALEIQRVLAAENEKVAAERRMPFRIGIHLGDVMVEESKIYGDGVNIAARLEGLSRPGGICLSDAVYQQVRRRLELAATDLGEQALKNIDEPVRAYRVELGDSAAAAAAQPALPLPDKPSLAILPFVNMSGDPSQEYFNDGLSQDIMTELSRLPGLFLIGEDAMFTYKDTGAKPRDVARELGVRHVLEGTVRRSDKRVRVTARLTEAETGRCVWAERYDRTLEDVFEVQDDIADHVVTALDVALVGGEGARTLRKHLRNPQALGLLFKGSELMLRSTREDTEEARQLLQEAAELAPDCPLVFSSLAWTHYFDVARRWSAEPVASLDRMSDDAHHALDLGDVSGYPSLMLAHMHLMRRDYEEALAVSELALKERPSCQGAFGLRANVLNYCGRPLEAIPLAQQAIRLSPVAQTFLPEVLATAHYLAGQHEEALATAQQTLSLAPDNVDARVVLVASLVETGRLDAAAEIAREILALDPDFSVARFAGSQPYRDPAVLDRLVDALRRAGVEGGNDSNAHPSTELAQPQAPARRRVAPRPRARARPS